MTLALMHGYGCPICMFEFEMCLCVVVAVTVTVAVIERQNEMNFFILENPKGKRSPSNSNELSKFFHVFDSCAETKLVLHVVVEASFAHQAGQYNMCCMRAS